MKNKVIVFAVHPDDETLGAGGTLLKHKSNGDEIHWVILTSMGKEIGFSDEKIKERQKEIQEVSAQYHFDSVTQLPFLATRLDQYPIGDIVQKISELVKKIAPDTVYLPFKNDIHTDHKVSFDALVGLTKTFRYPFIKKILCMEVLSETNFGHLNSQESFHPNYYVDISDYLMAKLSILKIYKSEINEHPFPRSLKGLEALATIRGSEINKNFAESFYLLKNIH